MHYPTGHSSSPEKIAVAKLNTKTLRSKSSFMCSFQKHTLAGLVDNLTSVLGFSAKYGVLLNFANRGHFKV